MMGGNVQINGQYASHIDISQLDREDLISQLIESLTSINATFERLNGFPIWHVELFKCRKFLSGSSFHLFDISNISTLEFISKKPTVGDIDTQVDVKISSTLEYFLSGAKGYKFEHLTFIGFKRSPGQFVTLWDFQGTFNIQIDMELVDFDDCGNPTAWAQFSHSSEWVDIQEGIKGVAHKYLLRAMEAPNLKRVFIPAKTARGKDKVIMSSERAFSVTYGLRTKLSPLGKYTDEIPHFIELSTQESPGTTDLNIIFKTWFGHLPSTREITQFNSFTGLIQLIEANLPKTSWKLILDGFVNTLWGAGAQALYRGDPHKDFAEKYTMLLFIVKEFGGNMSDYDDIKQNYYESYKI